MHLPYTYSIFLLIADRYPEIFEMSAFTQRVETHEQWIIRSRMSGATWRKMSKNEDEDKDESKINGLIKRRHPSLSKRIHGSRVYCGNCCASTITIAQVAPQPLRKRVYYSCIGWYLSFLSPFASAFSVRSFARLVLSAGLSWITQINRDSYT